MKTRSVGDGVNKWYFEWLYVHDLKAMETDKRYEEKSNFIVYKFDISGAIYSMQGEYTSLSIDKFVTITLIFYFMLKNN